MDHPVYIFFLFIFFFFFTVTISVERVTCLSLVRLTIGKRIDHVKDRFVTRARDFKLQPISATRGRMLALLQTRQVSSISCFLEHVDRLLGKTTSGRSDLARQFARERSIDTSMPVCASWAEIQTRSLHNRWFKRATDWQQRDGRNLPGINRKCQRVTTLSFTTLSRMSGSNREKIWPSKDAVFLMWILSIRTSVNFPARCFRYYTSVVKLAFLGIYLRYVFMVE